MVVVETSEKPSTTIRPTTTTKEPSSSASNPNEPEKESTPCTERFLPNLSDCNRYYECDNGHALPRSCPTGLHWNIHQQICDWPQNAKCEASGTGVTDPSSANMSPKPTAPTPATPTPTTCKLNTPPQTNVVHTEDDDGQFKIICYFTNWVRTSFKPPLALFVPSMTHKFIKKVIKIFCIYNTNHKEQKINGELKVNKCPFRYLQAWYRPGEGKYLPENIDENLCTHIVYGFAVLDGSTLTIKTHDSWADIDNTFYERVTAYRKKGIKVLVAIGGWNDSLGDKYSRLVLDEGARCRFISNVIEFIKTNNFDGLDLDWEVCVSIYFTGIRYARILNSQY